MTTDHEHVRGWKRMLPAERRLYVRGILCVWCNYRIVRRGATRAKLANAVVYLDAYERRSKALKAKVKPRALANPQR